MASGMKKVNMISQIVRLKQVVQKWKAKSCSRRRCSDSNSDSDPRTPLGCVAVLAGSSRFVIPTRFLNFPVFLDILQQKEEEFGFQKNAGPLILPCEPDFLQEVLKFLEEEEEIFRGLGLNAFVGLVSEMGLDQSTSCKENAASTSSFSPLLPNTRVYH